MLLVRWGKLYNLSMVIKQKYFGIVKVVVIILIMLTSYDDFSVATPDETAGKVFSGCLFKK